MKKTIFISWLIFFSVQLIFAQPEIKFEEKTKKFEKIKAGEVLSFDYSFTNIGNQPLLISEVKVTCGCTKPEFPQEPIKPGETGMIHVSFDTKGKIGYQDRILEVISNAKNSPEKIRFKGVVDNKKE
mgnify:CR=1 FL=1